MSKGQMSFAFAGLLFGFLVGFVVAHQVYNVRGGGEFVHPPMPDGSMPTGTQERPGAAGMGAGSGTNPGMAGDNPSGGAAGGGAPDMAMMEQVQKEIEALKARIEKEPGNVAALTRLGDMFFDAGKFDRAKELYESALAAKPDDINVQTDLGTVLRNLGQPQEAIKHFEAAVERQPDHWKGWFNIGIVSLYDLHDFQRAQQAFEKVAALKPDSINMDALKAEIEKVRSEHATGGGAS